MLGSFRVLLLELFLCCWVLGGLETGWCLLVMLPLVPLPLDAGPAADLWPFRS